MTIALILLILAFACFAIEAWWHKNLIALGLALWIFAVALLPRLN